MKSSLNTKTGGFTLVELMIAVSVFTVIVFISTGAIFSIVNSNQKSSNLRSSMDNINLVMDSMTRAIRFGNTYHCGILGDLGIPIDCAGGDSSLTFKAIDGSRVTYSISGGRITRLVCPVSGPCSNVLNMTSSDMIISSLTFWVTGSNPVDNLQPKVTVVVGGYVGNKATTLSSFTLETAISQKKLDTQ